LIIQISSDGRTVITGKTLYENSSTFDMVLLSPLIDRIPKSELSQQIQVRANHPMPARNYTYYFEVTIVNLGIKR
jgi:hypothetical protein